MPVPAPFCITIVSDVAGDPFTAVIMPPPITPPEFVMDWTLVHSNEPSDWRLASTTTSIPFAIELMLVPLKTVEEFVAKVKFCAACMEVITNEFPDTLEIDPIIC
jgi:hypothetical protein